MQLRTSFFRPQWPLAIIALAGCAAAPAQGQNAFPLDQYTNSGTRVSATPEEVTVNFGNKEDWPNITWKAPQGTPWDWSTNSALVLKIANLGKNDARFHVKLNDIGLDGKKGSVQVSGNARAGQTEDFYVSLQSRGLRKASGMRNLPPLEGNFGTYIGTGVEPNQVEALQIFRAKPKDTATLVIKSITLAGPPPTTNLDGIIDQYGQYTRADWPGKVHSDADLAAQKLAEEADLAKNPVGPSRSKWGGWLKGPRQKATGFFRTQLINGRWWFVDPEGYLFLSVGIDVIRPDVSTIVGGRENMFTWVPKDDDPLAKYYSNPGPKRNYNFLRANIQRKYGTDTDAQFADLTMKRLRSWGVNTIGNWTPEKLGQEQQFPYVVALGTKGTAFATVPGHRNGKMPDPFDPAWAAAVDESVAAKAAVAKNDPACVGYFYDNELPWGMPDVDAEKFVLAVGALGLPATSPAKTAFLDMLKARYPQVEQLNTAWGTKFAAWTDLEAPLTGMGVKNKTQRQDYSDFLSLYAEKYFETVATTLKKHDPNHLYLGARFAYWYTPEAVKAAGKFSDVISFNIYTWNRDNFQDVQQQGKPCIVGEFHFGATDRGMFSGNVNVKDQAARGESYANYVKNVLSEPAFIGVHWFQYYDMPTTGRGLDGENFNIGFVNGTDAPYTELIQAARDANGKIYDWHKGK